MVAVETCASGIFAAQRVVQAPDERSVGRCERGIDPLDVHVDAVDAGAHGQRDQALDGRVLEGDRSEELLIPRRPEARVHDLDAHLPVVRLVDQLLADRPRDPLVAELLGVQAAGLGVRDREQGERRQRRLRQVVGDVAVHLPVRDEPEQLVLRDRARGRNGGRVGGGADGRVRAVTRERAGPGRGGADGRMRGAVRPRSEPHDEGDDGDDGDGTDADDGPSGHGDSVGPTPDRVKRGASTAHRARNDERRWAVRSRGRGGVSARSRPPGGSYRRREHLRSWGPFLRMP